MSDFWDWAKTHRAWLWTSKCFLQYLLIMLFAFPCASFFDIIHYNIINHLTTIAVDCFRHFCSALLFAMPGCATRWLFLLSHSLTGVIAGKVVPTERQDLKPTHMTSWAIFSSVSFQTCCNQEGSLHVFALEVAVKHGAHRSSHKPKIAGTNLIGEEVEEVWGHTVAVDWWTTCQTKT